jgi:hypothetical protein
MRILSPIEFRDEEIARLKNELANAKAIVDGVTHHETCWKSSEGYQRFLDLLEKNKQTFQEWWVESVRLAQIHLGSGDYLVSKRIAEKAWNAAKGIK